MQVLWQHGPSTVRFVNDKLNEQKRAVQYTSTLKLMQIMFDKGLVLRDDSSRTHIYQPNVSKEKTQKQLLDKMVNSLFSGSHSQLVMQALGSHTPTRKELDEMQQLLDQYKK